MSTRHAVWYLGSKLNDSAGRYSIIYASGVPKVQRPDALVFRPQPILDAADPPRTGPDGVWDRFVRDGDLWLRGPDGHRITGWADGRGAVDLGREARWVGAVDQCWRAASAAFNGAHFDDLQVRSTFGLSVDAAAWAHHASLIASDRWWSISGGKTWLCPESLSDGFRLVKFEGFRFKLTPKIDGLWNHPGYNAMGTYTWESWFLGEPGWSPGLREMSKTQTVVLESYHDHTWPQAKIDQYQTLALATVLLTDNALVMAHSKEPGVWWKQPYWSEDYEKSLRLGNPKRPVPTKPTPNGLWTRNYENGRVAVNPTGVAVAGVGPQSGSITVAS